MQHDFRKFIVLLMSQKTSGNCQWILLVFHYRCQRQRCFWTTLCTYLTTFLLQCLAQHGTQETSNKSRKCKDGKPFVTRNYHDRHPGSVTQMVQQLQWEPLQVRRVKIRLVLLYKIQHGLSLQTYLVAGDTRTTGEHKFCPPSVR